MEKRPRIKPALTTTDTLLETVGWMAVVTIWLLTITSYSTLPDTIPIHYNAAGEADGFGAKIHLLMLPLVATVLFAGMTVLNKFPHIFNYPVTITRENVWQQYTVATRIIRYLKLIIVIIFTHIVWKTIQQANGQTEGLRAWFLPLMVGVIFIPLAGFIIKLVRKK